jgi:hypothetical protein
MQICDSIWVPQGCNSLRKQLSGLVLEVQQVIGDCFVEDLP